MLASASREGARWKCRNWGPWATHIKGDKWQERGEKAGILAGSEDACTLKLEFAVVRVEKGEATELLLVYSLHHRHIDRGQRGLLWREVAVKVIGVHLGFLKHSKIMYVWTAANCASSLFRCQTFKTSDVRISDSVYIVVSGAINISEVVHGETNPPYHRQHK